MDERTLDVCKMSTKEIQNKLDEILKKESLPEIMSYYFQISIEAQFFTVGEDCLRKNFEQVISLCREYKSDK